MISQIDPYKIYEYLNPVKSIIGIGDIDFVRGLEILTFIEIFRFGVEYKFIQNSELIQVKTQYNVNNDSDPNSIPEIREETKNYKVGPYFRYFVSQVMSFAFARVELELEQGEDRAIAEKFSIDAYNYVSVLKDLLNEAKFSNSELKQMVAAALEEFLQLSYTTMRLHGVNTTLLKNSIVVQEKVPQEIVFEPIHWQGNVSQLASLFADLMNKNRLPNSEGRAFINASTHQVEKFLLAAFRAKDGKELSSNTIRTYINPKHPKEVGEKNRIKPEMNS